jgi:predicted Zn-dependent peptidase
MRPRSRRHLLIGITIVLGIIPLRDAGTLVAQTRLAILEEARGTAVGLAVVINAGSVWELRPEAGLTYLAARSMIAELRPGLARLGGSASAECDPTGIRFTLILPVASWKAGASLFLEMIFDGKVTDSSVEEARGQILRESALTEKALSTEIRTALARARFGDADRWARPACGTAETIASLSATDARRLSETRFTPFRATAALVGPVDEAEARSLLNQYLLDSELPVLVPAPARGSAEKDRRIEHNTVTAWVGIAFPFPRGTDLEALRLLAFRILREVRPTPEQPEIYDATVEISQDGAGGALVVYLVTAPTQARAWISRVESIIREMAEAELGEALFEALCRRYTGERLLELARPEDRAREAALQLFFEASFTHPDQRIRALTPLSLRESAAVLMAPAVAILGPR